MSGSSPTRGSRPRAVRLERLAAALPDLPELAFLQELLVEIALPDPDRRWSGSGELGTVGDRTVDAGRLGRTAPTRVGEELDHLRSSFGRAVEVLEAVQEGDPARAIGLLLAQGEEEERRGRAGAARGWYRAAARLAAGAGDPDECTALRRAARVARTEGRLGEAADGYEEAWRKAAVAGREIDEVVAATGRGNVAVDQGRWAEGEEWYRRALERIGEGGKPRRERWQLLQNLAIVRRRSGDFGGARRLLDRARDEGAALGDPVARVEVANGRGQLLLAEGDPRGAELHFAEALREAGDPRSRVTIGVNLGEALLEQGRSLEAGEQGREAEAEAVRGRVIGKLPEVYRLLARVARDRGEGEAFLFLERALELIRTHGLPPFEEAETRALLGAWRVERGEEALGGIELERAAELRRGLGLGSPANDGEGEEA